MPAAFDVVAVKRGRHRLDALEEIGYGLDILVTVEDAALDGGLVGIVGYGVPCPKDHLVQARQGDQLAYQGAAMLRALPQPDGSHLGDGANGQAHAPAHMLHTGDEGGGNGSKSHQQHS